MQDNKRVSHNTFFTPTFFIDGFLMHLVKDNGYHFATPWSYTRSTMWAGIVLCARAHSISRGALYSNSAPRRNGSQMFNVYHITCIFYLMQIRASSINYARIYLINFASGATECGVHHVPRVTTQLRLSRCLFLRFYVQRVSGIWHRGRKVIADPTTYVSSPPIHGIVLLWPQIRSNNQSRPSLSFASKV